MPQVQELVVHVSSLEARRGTTSRHGYTQGKWRQFVRLHRFQALARLDTKSCLQPQQHDAELHTGTPIPTNSEKSPKVYLIKVCFSVGTDCQIYVWELDHDLFLPHTFKFVIHLLSFHLTLYNRSN
jgi:hypothetical protein